MIKETKDFYDNAATKWQRNAEDETNYFTRRTLLVRRLICREIQGPKTVLDVGCGSGHLCQKLSEVGFNVYGYDISEEMVKITKQRNANLSNIDTRFRVSKDGEIPFTQQFDIITALGVFPYVPDYYKFLAHLISYLTPEGYIIATCSNNMSLFVFFEIFEYIRRYSLFHMPKFRRQEIRNLLQTGIWTGGRVNYQPAKQCHSAETFDRLFQKNGFIKRAELDLYAVGAYGLWRLDRFPLSRSWFDTWWARRFSWNHIGVYQINTKNTDG